MFSLAAFGTDLDAYNAFLWEFLYLEGYLSGGLVGGFNYLDKFFWGGRGECRGLLGSRDACGRVAIWQVNDCQGL